MEEIVDLFHSSGQTVEYLFYAAEGTAVFAAATKQPGRFGRLLRFARNDEYGGEGGWALRAVNGGCAAA